MIYAHVTKIGNFFLFFFEKISRNYLFDDVVNWQQIKSWNSVVNSMRPGEIEWHNSQLKRCPQFRDRQA